MVRHLNKTGAGQAVYRGGGSIAFLAACRSGWLIARAPDAPDRCILAQVKNNLAPPQPSLAYSVQLQDDAPPVLSWLGTSSMTADQLVSSQTHKPPLPSKLDCARDFLKAFLADGPRTTREIWPVSRELRLARRTLQRARKALQIRTIRVRPNSPKRECYWLLPDQVLPSTIPPEDVEVDLEPWFAAAREQYNETTPLDDL
jgi:hypothetical protein